MVASKGYGPERGPGKGRGTFSVKMNPAPVPMKGSSIRMRSDLQNKDAGKVKEFGKTEWTQENLRGRSS